MPHAHPFMTPRGVHPVTGCPQRADTTGWVTFQTIRTADGRVLLVQKRDGCIRTILAPSGAHR